MFPRTKWKSSPSKSTRKKSPIHLCQAPTLPSKSGPAPRTATPCNANAARFQPRWTLNGPGVQPARSLPREWPLKSLGVSENTGWNMVELEMDEIWWNPKKLESWRDCGDVPSMSSIVWGWTWCVRSLEGQSHGTLGWSLQCVSAGEWLIWGKIPRKIPNFQ